MIPLQKPAHSAVMEIFELRFVHSDEIRITTRGKKRMPATAFIHGYQPKPDEFGRIALGRGCPNSSTTRFNAITRMSIRETGFLNALSAPAAAPTF